MKRNLLTLIVMLEIFLHIYTIGKPVKIQETKASKRKQIDLILDAFHGAAAKADKNLYFGFLSDDAIFMGTDANERWTKSKFIQYASPYFAQGKGWTYIPGDRHVMFSDDGNFAWFDERLFNVKYGELRGTGVLHKKAGIWKIVHYNMVFTIPNEIAGKVVKLIKSHKSKVEQ